MADLHHTIKTLSGGGQIIFQYLTVIAAFLGEYKALLQQALQRNTFLSGKRVGGSAEKGNVCGEGAGSLPVGTGNRFVQKKDQVENALVQVFYRFQGCHHLKMDGDFRIFFQKRTEQIGVL